jgi:hypothetical protein
MLLSHSSDAPSNGRHLELEWNGIVQGVLYTSIPHMTGYLAQ